MPCVCRGAARTLGAIVLTGLAGCALVAPLDGLTGGDGGFVATGSRDDGAAADDVRETLGQDASTGGHRDDAGGSGAPGDDGATAGQDSGGSDDSSAGDAASSGDDGGAAVDAGSGDEVAMIDEQPPPPPPPPPTIAFVQVASATVAATAQSISATFAQPQGAGDLDVVAIGWNDTTSSVTSVKDSVGNTYRLAVGPTRFAPDLSQAIYYAENVGGAGAGGNTVTVSFDAAANAIDLRILEYSGLRAASALDVVAAKAGTGAGDVSSGQATTRADSELIVGAGMTTDVYVNGGSSFNQRAITALGDIAEDRVVSSAGAYAADAPVGAASEFVMQMVTFR